MKTDNLNPMSGFIQRETGGRQSAISTIKIVLWTLAFQLAWHFGKIRNQLTEGHFQDPDDFLRLHQVRNWKSGLNGWFDVSVPRMNPPLGGDMHWSRLIDVPLAGLSRFFELFFSQQTAEALATIIWPTVLLVLTVLVLVAITRKLFPVVSPLMTVLFAVTCVTSLVEFAPARIDHHNVQILLFGLIMLGLVSADRKWGHALIGFSTVLSIVIGLDLLLMLVLILAWLGLEWVLEIDENGAGLKRTGIAMALSALVLYPVTVPASDWLVAKCDAMSSVYLAAFIAIAVGFVTLGSLGRFLKTSSFAGTAFIRAMAGGASALLIILLLYSLYPQCALGPMSGITPELKALWLDGVVEAMGLVAFAREYDMRWYAIPAFVLMNILAGLYLIVTKQAHPRFIAIWATLAITFVLGFYQVRTFRIGLFATVPVCAAIAHIVMGWITRRYHDNRVIRGAATALAIIFLLTPTWLIVGGLVGGSFSPARPAPAIDAPRIGNGEKLPPWATDPTRTQCDYRSDFALLEKLPKGLVFNGINIGPAILVFTDHSIIGGNYHRNGAAILDTYHFFKGDEANALQLLSKHKVKYIALCRRHPSQPFEKYAPDTIGGKILADNLPRWLRQLSAPEDHLVVVEIDRAAAGFE